MATRERAEARLDRLESEMGHLRNVTDKIDGAVSALRKAVEDLRVDYARFDERSKYFPTKGFIFSTATAMLGAATALTALIVRFLPSVP
jgi:uncharacterized coiled-coil protein SlyX